MEVQVNVAQDGGRKTGGVYKGKNWSGWTDGNVTWKSFRIPWGAKKDPHYVDTEIKFSLEEHVESVGMTGWNWKQKKSCWIGFDFDSITNHKEGLTEEELIEVTNKVSTLPYVTVLKSTSGRGIHVYIHLEKPGLTTNTHTEHAALARSLLSVMSMDVGYNFANAVDVCGMVLWCYHRKSKGTEGLSLLKQGTPFPLSRIPDNWRAQIEVTSGSRRRVSYGGKDTDDLFNLMATATKQTPLDKEHRRLLDWFKNNTSSERDSWWDNDYGMLVCHTFDLARAHKELGLKGIFKTNSSGSSSQNCYAFPSDNGSWTVRRHSPGTSEHPSWIVDPSGWTRCTLNAPSDLATCVRAAGGLENASGDYVFKSADMAVKALEDLGVYDVSNDLKANTEMWEKVWKNRMTTFRRKGEGRLIIIMERNKEFDNEFHIPGFCTNARGNKWERVIRIPIRKKEFQAPDHLIRHVIADQAEAGWFIKTKRNWVMQPRHNVITVLESQQSVAKGDLNQIMSRSILDPWELVNIPFAGEYPGNRQWNKDAAAFSCSPEEGPCDTWLDILNHVGKGIDLSVKEDPWCAANGITTGKDYLMCWIANMLQKPYEPLPYLFLTGPQKSGKSTLHEAIAKLFTRGYARAENALRTSFNGNMAGAVLCVVEEIDLGRDKDALNKIKDWVTSKTISIHAKGSDSYDLPNTSHWIQCANDIAFCPVFPGDTRIVVIHVDPPKQEKAKYRLEAELEKEKKAFLHLCLNMDLPETDTRLGVPCISSQYKVEAETSNMTLLEQFISEETYYCEGAITEYDDFYNQFVAWLDPHDRGYWTRMRVARAFPKNNKYCKGKVGSNNVTVCGNITFNKDEEPKGYKLYVNSQGRIQKDD